MLLPSTGMGLPSVVERDFEFVEVVLDPARREGVY